MRLILALTAALFITGCGRSATRSETPMSHPNTPQHSPEALSLGRITPREPGVTLELLSTAIDIDGTIEPRYTAYGDNVSPPLRWTAGNRLRSIRTASGAGKKVFCSRLFTPFCRATTAISGWARRTD